MKLIKLTSITGDEFAINTDFILKVWNREEDNVLMGSTVLTKDGDELLVSELLEEIVKDCNKK